MPDNEQTLIEKAGRVLSAASSQAVMDAFNATASAMNKLMELLKRAGIEAAAEEGGDEAPPEGEEETTEDNAPPPDDEAEADEEEKEPVEKMVMRPTQAEVNYVTVSTKRGTACANCRWFSAHHHDHDMQAIPYCHLIENWPDDILPTGYCDRHEGKPEMAEPAPIPVVIVEQARKEQRDYLTFTQHVKAMWRALRQPAEHSDFSVFKDASGQWRWIARYTNNFQDLDGEIISEKALEDYVRRVNMGLVPLPTLRVWHIPGSDHGQAEQVFGHGSFVYAVGTFDDTPEARHAIEQYRKDKGRTRLSQGFTHPAWAFKDGVYTVMNTFEISTLPPGAAANPFTSFEEIQTMQIGEQQRLFLEKTLGKDKAAEILATAEKDTETVKELGVAYKDFSAITPKPETPTLSEEQIVAKAFVDLVEAQSEVLRIAQAQEAAIVALKSQYDADVAALKAELETVKATAEASAKQLSLAPRRASTDPKTALSDEQAKAVQKQIPTDIDPFFGDLFVPKKEA